MRLRGFTFATERYMLLNAVKRYQTGVRFDGLASIGAFPRLYRKTLVATSLSPCEMLLLEDGISSLVPGCSFFAGAAARIQFLVGRYFCFIGVGYLSTMVPVMKVLHRLFPGHYWMFPPSLHRFARSAGLLSAGRKLLITVFDE